MKTLKPQEVFEYLLPLANYLAMDMDEKWFAYLKIPEQGICSWESGGCRVPLNIDYTGDWKDSLHCRNPELKAKNGIDINKPEITISLDPSILKRIEDLEKKLKELEEKPQNNPHNPWQVLGNCKKCGKSQSLYNICQCNNYTFCSIESVQK